MTAPLSVLLVHGYYRLRGGEDELFDDDRRLLADRGHRVLTYTRHNNSTALKSSAALALGAAWNREAYHQILELVRRERPDVVQFQNTQPLISPAAYWAAKRGGAAVVQSLTNYRLACVNGLFLRDGQACEKCLGSGLAWPGVRHRCYRDSRAASATVASALALHRLLGTWRQKVDVYTAQTRFLVQKMIEAGLPEGRIQLRYNYLDNEPGEGRGGGGYALFVGRLSEEKGVELLLEAWRRLRVKLPLKIVGDGPLEALVRACEGPQVERLGRRSRQEVFDLMRSAELLVLPSICYEAGPQVICEAFAAGLPVVGSGHGAIAAMIDDGENGLLFPPGNSDALRSRVETLWETPDRLAAMRAAARRTFDLRHRPSAVYRQMLDSYRAALEHSGAGGAPPPC